MTPNLHCCEFPCYFLSTEVIVFIECDYDYYLLLADPLKCGKKSEYLVTEMRLRPKFRVTSKVNFYSRYIKLYELKRVILDNCIIENSFC